MTQASPFCTATALALLVSGALHGAAVADQPVTTRVALVAMSKEVPAAAAIELAAVGLSQDSGLELLERDRIREVLREQEIAAFGKDLYPRLLQVGKLLRADVLVTLSPGSDPKLQRCVALDSATGCRLRDVTLSATTPRDLAEAIKRATHQALTKRRLLRNSDVRLVAFHGWRNADIPSGKEAHLRAIREQLEQKVASSEGLVVLERARLRVVNDENRLPTSRRHARLLASAAYIIPQFSKPTSGAGVELTLVLRDVANQQEKSVSQLLVAGNEADALGELVQSLHGALAARDAATPLIERGDEGLNQERLHYESMRLHAEAKRLQEARDWVDATAFYEASYAVDPGHTKNLMLLIGLLDERAHALLEPIRQASHRNDYRPEDHFDSWSKAFELLEYRLDLIVLQHGKQKHLKRWPEKVTRGVGGGGWPPWQESANVFRLIDRNAIPKVHRIAKRYCDRYLAVLYGEIAEYARKHCKTNNALDGAIEMSHSRCNYKVARISGRWPKLIFEEFDRWEAVLLSDRWTHTRHQYRHPVDRLLNLIEFKDYERHAVDDSYAGAIRERVQRVADQFPIAEIRTGIRLLELDKKYFELRQPELIASRAESLIEKAFTQVTRKLPENPQRSHFMYPGNNGPKPVDIRRKWDLHLLMSAVAHHPNKQQVTKKISDRLIAAGVFSPAFMRVYLPKEHTWDGKSIPESLRAWLIACREAQSLLETHRREFTRTDYQQALNYLDWRIRQLQSELATHDSEGLKFWSKLHLIEGLPKWPSSYSEEQSVKIIGFLVQGDSVYYLVAGRSRPGWELKELSLDGEFTPRSISTLRNVPNLGNLTAEQRADWDAASRLSVANTRYKRFAADDHRFYLAHSGFGIYGMPLDGDKPWLLNEQSGLPSNFIHSLCVAEGKLYAWVGRVKKEMQLVVFDPATSKIEVLISSGRLDNENPFAEQQPEVVPFVYWDKARERLLFLVGYQFWQLDLATRKITPWVELTRSGLVGHPDCRLSVDSVRVVNNGEEMLINRGRAYWSVDVKTGAHRRFPEKGSLKTYPGGDPCAWRGSRLWIDSQWQAYDPKTNRSLRLQHPFPEQQQQPGYGSVRTCETAKNERFAVIQDSNHLWIAELLDPEQTDFDSSPAPSKVSSKPGEGSK